MVVYNIIQWICCVFNAIITKAPWFIFGHFFPSGANNHAMVRVLSLEFGERSLLKGFTGAVTDLAFAHLDSSLLGCVDEAGNLMVWQLTYTANKILYPECRRNWMRVCVCVCVDTANEGCIFTT